MASRRLQGLQSASTALRRLPALQATRLSRDPNLDRSRTYDGDGDPSRASIRSTAYRRAQIARPARGTFGWAAAHRTRNRTSRQAKIQAQVLVPLVKALQAELGEERANALVRKALGDVYRRLGEQWWRAKNRAT